MVGGCLGGQTVVLIKILKNLTFSHLPFQILNMQHQFVIRRIPSQGFPRKTFVICVHAQCWAEATFISSILVWVSLLWGQNICCVNMLLTLSTNTSILDTKNAFVWLWWTVRRKNNNSNPFSSRHIRSVDIKLCSLQLYSKRKLLSNQSLQARGQLCAYVRIHNMWEDRSDFIPYTVIQL